LIEKLAQDMRIVTEEERKTMTDEEYEAYDEQKQYID